MFEISNDGSSTLILFQIAFQTRMAKDYLGSDQRKVRPDDKKDEKEIKVQFSKNIFNISGFNGKINLFYFLVQFLR